MNRVKVFIADDHHIFRMGLAHLIETCGNFKVAGEAGDGATALKGIKMPIFLAFGFTMNPAGGDIGK